MLKFLLSIFGFVILINVCDRARADIEYYFAVVNKTENTMHSVSIYYNNEEVTAMGNLVKGGYKTDGPVTFPTPPQAEVRWKENGTNYTAKAKLEGSIPKKFIDYNLYFIIKTNRLVEVKIAKTGDLDANLKIIK